MARFRDLLKAAERLGSIHGSGAAAWYWDSTHPDKADFQRVLKGILEVDPEIMDTFPSGHLSGEMADDMTPKLLYEEIGANEKQQENGGDDLCTAYEHAFDRVYEGTIVENCREELESEFTLTINVKIIEETPDTASKWASSVENVAAQNRLVSIDDCNLIDEEDERVW